MTNEIFEIAIDGDKYGLIEVKEWADELEKTPKQILDMVQNWDEKQWALFAHENFIAAAIEDISEMDIDTDMVSIWNEDYYVLTDSEADKLADEMLDNYIDECVLCEIPENYRDYFDSEKFKEDVLRWDGRESQLSSYDGFEHVYSVNGIDIYIYRC